MLGNEGVWESCSSLPTEAVQRVIQGRNTVVQGVPALWRFICEQTSQFNKTTMRQSNDTAPTYHDLAEGMSSRSPRTHVSYCSDTLNTIIQQMPFQCGACFVIFLTTVNWLISETLIVEIKRCIKLSETCPGMFHTHTVWEGCTHIHKTETIWPSIKECTGACERQFSDK